MRILLLGGDGQVGWELRRSLSILGDVVALARKPGKTGDLQNLDGLRKVVRDLCPGVIVNAAAYTNVAGAEHERDAVFMVNALAPEVMAREAARCGALLVHFSSDYVYNGKSLSPYTENVTPSPLNVYGESKLAGDRFVIESGCDYLIFRTSWVYSVRRNNFLTTMVKLLYQRDQLNVVADQFGAPTSAELIADVTANALTQALKNRNLLGLYHLTAKGSTSWYDYAVFIADVLRARQKDAVAETASIIPVTAEEYDAGVVRPRNSCLNTSRLEQAFGLTMPEWEAGVSRVVNEWMECEVRSRK